MSTIQMDRLLEAVVTQGASDLHLAVGRPPTLRLHGGLRSLKTKVLEPDDTTALMKSIAPEKNQQELAESGSSDFGFAYGDKARFRVSIFKQRGNVGLVLRQIPNRMAAHHRGRSLPPPPRPVPGHRSDRFRQVHHSRLNG